MNEGARSLEEGKVFGLRIHPRGVVALEALSSESFFVSLILLWLGGMIFSMRPRCWVTAATPAPAPRLSSVRSPGCLAFGPFRDSRAAFCLRGMGERLEINGFMFDFPPNARRCTGGGVPAGVHGAVSRAVVAKTHTLKATVKFRPLVPASETHACLCANPSRVGILFTEAAGCRLS